MMKKILALLLLLPGLALAQLGSYTQAPRYNPGNVAITGGSIGSSVTFGGSTCTFTATGLNNCPLGATTAAAVSGTTGTFSGASLLVTGSNALLAMRAANGTSNNLSWQNAAGTAHWYIYETTGAAGEQGALVIRDPVAGADRLQFNTGSGTAAFTAAVTSSGSFTGTNFIMTGGASNISQVSSGVLGVGTGAAGSTAGSLSLTNLTASGTLSINSGGAIGNGTGLFAWYAAGSDSAFIDARNVGIAHKNLTINGLAVNLQSSGSTIAAVSSTGVAVTGNVSATGNLITATQSPASGAACTTGTLTWDASYLYACTASGAWKRTALTGGY